MTRFIAALCLVAMLGSWAPHAHSSADGSDGARAHGPFAAHHDATPNAARPFTVSSDDAHEEHSSRAAIETSECVVCRSAKERQADRTSSTHLPAFDVLATRIGAHPDRPLPTVLAIDLHPTRAPPLG